MPSIHTMVYWRGPPRPGTPADRSVCRNKPVQFFEPAQATCTVACMASISMLNQRKEEVVSKHSLCAATRIQYIFTKKKKTISLHITRVLTKFIFFFAQITEPLVQENN